jgi:Mn2+/Fe2+ NRAMP family transporter
LPADDARGFASLPRRPLPRFPAWWAALGPGVVWMALAQGSGELISWPYLVAKYGLTFLWLLIPACLLQYPLNVEIGRYTLLTGESIFRGFFRLHAAFGLFLWMLMTASFLWFGAFASAGGTAMAVLTGFPASFSVRGRTLFWAYATVAVFVAAIALSGVVYRMVERFMKAVALTTVVGLLWACAQPEVTAALPSFVAALVRPPGPSARAWDVHDATTLLTAITFAGLGGFWILLYSYWLREKGSGMAAHGGRITGMIMGKPEPVAVDGHLIDASETSAAEWPRWRRYLTVDALVGIVGNLATTLMTCLLAYALLYPRGLFPEEYEIAVAQSRFFEPSWGPLGRVLFLIVGAAFLTDTWLATADGVSRMQADVLHTAFPWARRWSPRRWYYLMLTLLTAITCGTLLLDAPGPLIPLSAVIGFAGTVMFPPALYVLNHRLLSRIVPPWARPRAYETVLLGVSFAAYALLAIAYAWATLH